MFKLFKNIRKKELILSIVCAILVVIQVYFDLKLPDFMTELSNLIQKEGEIAAITEIGIKMIICTIISAVLAIICGFISAYVAAGLSFVIRKKVFNHVIELSKEDMHDFSVASLITRTTNDITQIQMIISMGLQAIIKSPVMAIWAIMKILNKSFELSLVTAVFVIIICVAVFIIMSICLPRFRLVQKTTDKINLVARENLTGINVVHAFNAEEYQNDKFDVPSKKMFNLQIKNQRLFALFQPIMQVSMNGLSLSIYWIGAYLINNINNIPGKITMFSDILAFGTYATYIIMSFMMLIMIFMMLPQAQVSIERINEVLDKKISIKEGNISKTDKKGKLEFKNVYFKYPDSDEYFLEDINFSIDKGETLAIIGATGSGKTTLTNLMLRLYDAQEGEVLIDDINIKDFSFESLYDKVSFVSQKAILFKGTIKDNINFGKTNNTLNYKLDEILDISKSSEFVNKFDLKENHEVAQLGRNLSGGQKQRLSIARSLRRNPEIIIFDDSFSALDYKTDKDLRLELNNKFPETTKIIIAQRIGTIRNADKIIVIEKGKIVGIGKHKDLINNCEIYKEIANSQLSEDEL